MLIAVSQVFAVLYAKASTVCSYEKQLTLMYYFFFYIVDVLVYVFDVLAYVFDVYGGGIIWSILLWSCIIILHIELMKRKK